MRSAENFPFRGKFSEVYLHLYYSDNTILETASNVRRHFVMLTFFSFGYDE